MGGVRDEKDDDLMIDQKTFEHGPPYRAPRRAACFQVDQSISRALFLLLNAGR